MNPDPATNPAPETPTPRLEPFPVPPPPIEFKLSDRIADLERALTDAKRENERLKSDKERLQSKLAEWRKIREADIDSALEVAVILGERLREECTMNDKTGHPHWPDTREALAKLQSLKPPTSDDTLKV